MTSEWVYFLIFQSYIFSWENSYLYIYFYLFREINPAENRMVAFLTSGEGWHNYHHVFPWDYKAAELGNYSMNMTTAAIDFFSWLGLAYDLKSVPQRIIRSRVNRTGDGSHPFSLEDSQYTAEDIKEEEQFCEIIPEDKKN
jgi:stearoyl-CoA desaturase (delta-9 desaturase)